ncbi:MAG: hypothetical protein QMD53_06885 [Actinomycetota bacterium]|nr:hypothetical protein [Actinomycetota bacterium]
MEKRDILTKALATVGTILIWFPILAPILLTIIFFIARGLLRFDFLMPAELFLFALTGGVLLFFAAGRAGLNRKLIASSLAIAIGALFAAQGLAVVTGLASGRIRPTGFWFVVVLLLLAVYIFALIALGAGGISLLRDLAKKTTAQGNTP